MKSSYVTLFAILCSALTAAAACSTNSTSGRLHSGTGAGGDDSSGNGNWNGVGTGQPVGSTGTGGSVTSTSTGGTCKFGGMSCQFPTDCCSGSCQNGLCTMCSAFTQSCDAAPCCTGLVCDQNTCNTCKSDGGSCVVDGDCCGGTCASGTCGASAACSMTCLAFITGGPPVCDNAPAASANAFADVAACICSPSNCGGPCALTCALETETNPSCTPCEQSAAVGACSSQVSTCESN